MSGNGVGVGGAGLRIGCQTQVGRAGHLPQGLWGGGSGSHKRLAAFRAIEQIRNILRTSGARVLTDGEMSYDYAKGKN